MIYLASKACCLNSIDIQVLGDCVRWIDREVLVATCLCIVRLGVEQQYSESPDVYNSYTVKARIYL